MISAIQSVGRAAIQSTTALGELACFAGQIFRIYPKKWVGLSLWLKALYKAGTQSLLIMIVAGFFIGMVLGLQGYVTLVKFGAEASLGPLVALSLVRELGPVVTALLFAGRAGSAIAAEIGHMKSTEQLSSLEMMAVDPMRWVIAPRFWAAWIAVPLLTLIFMALGIIGGYIACVTWLQVDAGTFWSGMQANVDWYNDVLNGVLKSAVFGFILALLAVYRGYDAMPTSEGISSATTRMVVEGSLAILAFDFILTALLFS